MQQERLGAAPCFNAPLAPTRQYGKSSPGKNRTPFPAIAIVNTTHDIGSNDPTESNTRGHPVILKCDVPVVIEYLPGIQEWRNFEIRAGARNLCTQHMNALFDTERYEMLVNETIDAESAQIILPTQRTLLEERHLSPDRRLEIRPHDENRALRFTGEQLLDIELISGIDGVIAVSDILIQFRIGRHGHPVGR